MIGVNNFSKSYAQALVSATAPEHLVNGDSARIPDGIKPEDLERMRKEVEALETDYRAIEKSYGDSVLNLTLARGYLTKMLDNGKGVRFLSSHYPEIPAEFNKIIEASPLE